LHEFEKTPYNVLPEMEETEDGMFVQKGGEKLFPLIYSIKATKK
jgi:hypothetical protein